MFAEQAVRLGGNRDHTHRSATFGTSECGCTIGEWIDTPRAAGNPFWCVMLARFSMVARGGRIPTSFGSVVSHGGKRERHAPYSRCIDVTCRVHEASRRGPFNAADPNNAFIKTRAELHRCRWPECTKMGSPRPSNVFVQCGCCPAGSGRICPAVRQRGGIRRAPVHLFRPSRGSSDMRA